MGCPLIKPQVPSEKLLKTLLNKLKYKLESDQYNLESYIRISLAEGLKHKYFKKLPLRPYLRTRQEIINNIDASNYRNFQETNNTIDIKEDDLKIFCKNIFDKLRNRDDILPEDADSWFKNGTFYAKHINYFKNKISSALWDDFHLVFLISYTFSYKKCVPPITNYLIENEKTENLRNKYEPSIPNHSTETKRKNTKDTANSICEATTSRETKTSNKRKAPSLPAELPSAPKQEKTSISANVIQATTRPVVVDIDKKLVSNVEKGDEEFGSISHIGKIYGEAKKFEQQVRDFCSTDGSLEYYVLDENLMKLKELLDRIKCNKDEVEKKEKKIMVIKYISKLQDILDENVVE